MTNHANNGHKGFSSAGLRLKTGLGERPLREALLIPSAAKAVFPSWDVRRG